MNAKKLAGYGMLLLTGALAVGWLRLQALGLCAPPPDGDFIYSICRSPSPLDFGVADWGLMLAAGAMAVVGVRVALRCWHEVRRRWTLGEA